MVDGGIKGRRVAHWPQLLNKVFLLVGVVDVRALDHKARANQMLTVSAEIHVLTVAAQPAAQIRLKKRGKFLGKFVREYKDQLYRVKSLYK